MKLWIKIVLAVGVFVVTPFVLLTLGLLFFHWIPEFLHVHFLVSRQAAQNAGEIIGIFSFSISLGVLILVGTL